MMDIIFAMGRATGLEVQERLPDKPSYSAVRTILRVLERKGYLRHVEEGQKYIYEPAISRETARQSAMRRLISTFFDGSAKAAAAALLDPSSSQLSEADLKELESLIRTARKEKAR